MKMREKHLFYWPFVFAISIVQYKKNPKGFEGTIYFSHWPPVSHYGREIGP